jgi:cytochrome-b5 reductase
MVHVAVGVLAGVLGGACSTLWAASRRTGALAECAPPPAAALSPDEFRPFEFISSRYESHDTRRFLFALPSANSSLQLPVASCILTKLIDAAGQEVTRPYTPISSNQTKGQFELLVKQYPKGRMGNHLFAMQKGEQLLVKGPFEKFAYQPNMWKHVGMIAGGTGITPMYQVTRAILENSKDKTRVSLLYANNQRRDILLANELIELQKTYNNFQLYLTLLEVPRRWLGGIGYTNAAMVRAFMPKPGEKHTKILVCGPPPMLKAICGDKLFTPGKSPEQGPLDGLLRELGYKEEQVFKF